MKMTVAQLRELFRQGIDEASKIAIHPEYMKKEAQREKIQTWITQAVADGSISSQEQLNEFVATIDMAMKSLKMIPFDVFKKMAGTAPKQ